MVLPVMLLILWLLLNSAAPPARADPSAIARQADLIRQAAASAIHPGDTVLLSTGDDAVRQSVDSTGASIRVFDPAAPVDVQTDLSTLVDGYCTSHGSHDAYLIWTDDPGRGAFEMGSAMRGLNFFFKFQTLLPYKGYNVYAVDKFLRLEPKTAVIARYCEALNLATGRDVVAILGPRAFSPWIGMVRTAKVTWLAADPLRTMVLSDFTVGGLPPFSTYDAYWLGITESGFTWSFMHRDTEAYREVFSQPGVTDALLLMDKEAVIGLVAAGFVSECGVTDALEGAYFRRVCLK
jgi:hypothetical protein